jgi:hypothetical protein
MSTELTVTVKGEESTYKQKFLLYEDIMWAEDDAVIKKCVDEALSNAKIEPEDIKVRALLVMR